VAPTPLPIAPDPYVPEPLGHSEGGPSCAPPS
jgi:hypothetical protein